MKTPANIKTMAGLCNYLTCNHIHDIAILRWRSLYQVQIGTHDSNVFMTIDLSAKTVNWCKRLFNGTNYDVTYATNEYMTMTGREKLMALLNK